MVVGLLLMAVGCTQAASTEPDSSAISKDYQSYSKDGLHLKHPKHWALAYDDNDALYSDRAVAFNISEGNVVTVFIYDNTSISVSDIRNDYIRRLKLETSEYVKDLKNSQINIGNYSGEELRWTDTMLIPFTTEITIFQVTQIPSSVFVVFELLEKDIEKISPHILPVLNSITFTQ